MSIQYLKRLESEASPAPIYYVEHAGRLFWLCSDFKRPDESVISGHPNFRLITTLRNHAKTLIAVVEAAESLCRSYPTDARLAMLSKSLEETRKIKALCMVAETPIRKDEKV